MAAEIGDDGAAGALGLAAEAIPPHGALAGVELYHGGTPTANGSSRAVRLAPSQLTSTVQWGGLAKEMDTADIARVQRDWAQAARRAADVGFDIVYVYGAHGYLMTQFLSAHTNQRTDGYGGSPANPGRFWMETLAAERGEAGGARAFATRIGGQ